MKYTYEQLMEKIIRARIHLEKASHGGRHHSNFCPMEDPESYAPCNCGAADVNRPIEDAIRELKL